MPLTFIDIERQKNWRIPLFFALLVVVYLAVIGLLVAVFSPLLLETPSRFYTTLLPAAALIAGIHLWFSASNAVSDLVRSLDARPPDPDDSIHRMFTNVMEELHVVTGNQRPIACTVIPSLSLNAMAIADLRGHAMIGITEGLLSRLTRAQLEAVVAHEAHHILSGDCLETTVAASIFGVLSSTMEKFRSSRSFAVFAILLAWLLLQLGYLLNMFISREREYRADAAAVRMSRNPLALAEVLYLLSRSWRGAGFIGSGLEMLCIVNPQATVLDETEGFMADLLSTHPPLQKRMDILLAMARVPISELEEHANSTTASPPSVQTATYYAMSPRHAWEGPFTVAELAVLPWLGPLTWIAAKEGGTTDRAWKTPSINNIFLSRLVERGASYDSTGPQCPTCHQPLVQMNYEGMRDLRCSYCAGTLVKTTHVPRIIARTGRANPCSERINALAHAVLRESRTRRLTRVHSGYAQESVPKIACPECRKPMFRSFYSLTYLVEVDRCSSCGVTWFDRDELEMLQCMVEYRLVDGMGGFPVMPDAAPAGSQGAGA
jgi:heat shock protein HtpX